MMTRNEEAIAKLLRFVEEHREIDHLEDGYLYFFPENHGAISAWELRAIADELDRRNAPWDAEINRYFSEQPKG